MANEIFFTCGLLSNRAKADHIEFPISPILVDEELHASITGMHVSLNQASAEWCESKCIADALQKVLSSISISKERLATLATK